MSAVRKAASGSVFLVGAGVYAILQRSGAVEFTVTPLIVGIIAVIAGLASSRRGALGTGLVLAGRGTAVLLVDSGAIPAQRATPACMLGIDSLLGAVLGGRSAGGATGADCGVAERRAPRATPGPTSHRPGVGSTAEAELQLITCGGEVRPSDGAYLQKVVGWAAAAPSLALT